ncbi:hypothetical protein [Roseofilum capinflatum]|uniref:Uncharacterized protein n=1 Tax=Roseofilum capinflatum BLCC-M114 TaxID=3022440 RepID=A0ABT7BB84_9CYAN|nr:hypothetical protein [Roseofilum capinflatum]MDJ1176444.1 hypothetical protein [Roseofilum capinflatum BLCC-M114]
MHYFSCVTALHSFGYTLVPEGLIHNYNGYEFKIAPALEGLDFNRNYPYYWQPEGEQQCLSDW